MDAIAFIIFCLIVAGVCIWSLRYEDTDAPAPKGRAFSLDDPFSQARD